MNSWTRSRKALLSLTAVAVLTACGGGDGATTTGVDEGTTADGNTTETSAPMTSEPGQDGGEGLPGVTSTCVNAGQAVAAAVTSYSTAIASAMSGTLDTDAFQEVTDQLQAMAVAAPDEIKADLEVMATEIGALYAAWAEIGYTSGAAPTPEQIAQLEALSEVIDQDAYTEAAENLEAWFQANC